MLSPTNQELISNYNGLNNLLTILDYLNTLVELPKIKNIETSITKETTPNLDKVKEMYQNLFKVKEVYYYPDKTSIFKINRIKTYNKLELTSPFDIPITYNYPNDLFKNSVEFNIPLQKLGNIPVVKSITLTPSSITDAIYIHELTHTQYNPKDNSIYSELLPIFMEKYTEDYLNKNKNMFYLRINDLHNNISKLLKMKYFCDDELSEHIKYDAIKYIESTLQAYMLYHIYKNEPLTSLKARIIDDIQSVINETITINDLLTKHDITSENSKKLTLFKSYFK